MFQVEWGTVAAVTVVMSFLAGIIIWLFRPHCRSFVWHVIESDPVKLDAVLRASADREQQQDAFAQGVREVLQSELKSLELTARMADSHEDGMRFLRESLLRQGEELRQLPTIATALKQNAEAMGQMAATMKEIHEEVTEHSKRFERWDGYMEGLEGKWDGKERRRKARRKTDEDNA